MSNTTPTFGADVQLLVPTTITLGNAPTTIYLDTRPVGSTGTGLSGVILAPCSQFELIAQIGRLATTVLSAGIILRVQRMYYNGGVWLLGGALNSTPGQVTVAVATTIAGSGWAAGSNVCNVTSTTGFNPYDTLFVSDTSYVRPEFGIVSKVESSTQFYMSMPAAYTHTSGQADPVHNYADLIGPTAYEGGYVYAITVDASNQSGPSTVCAVLSANIAAGFLTQ